MRVNKLMALGLAGLMTAGIVANVSVAEAADGLVMSWWGNQVRNERTVAALEKYEELTGTHVDGQFFQWGDYWDKLATDAAGNALPDLIQMDLSYIASYVESGLLLDLTPYIESGALDASNIAENVLVMGKVGDGNYGIASGVNAPCVFYNKTVADEAGVEMKDNMTIDEFVEVARTVYEKTGYRTDIMRGGALIREWTRAEGFSIQEAKPPVDSPDPYVPFFELQKQGIDEGWAMTPDLLTSTGIEDSPLVYGGSPDTMAWVVINGGSNLLKAFQAAAPEGVEICVTTCPTSDTSKSNYLKPSMFFSVSATAADPDAAVALLNYLTNSEECNDILLGERGVPVSSKIGEYIYDKLEPKDQEIVHFVNDVITPNCSPIDPPDPDRSNELTDTITKIQEAVGYGAQSPEDAAAEYYNKMVEIWG